MSSNTDSLKQRIRKLNASMTPPSGPVIYVMSRDIRTIENHALLAAQQHAMAVQQPLIVLFVGYDTAPVNRAQEHIGFLLNGLDDVATELRSKAIPLILRVGQPVSVWCDVVKQCAASAVYFDFSPLTGPLKAKQAFAKAAEVPVYEVDTHNAVPVWVASPKQEVGARTLRPKIHYHLPSFIDAPLRLEEQVKQLAQPLESLSLTQLISHLLPLYPRNGTDISRFTSGQHAAGKALEEFIDNRLKGYATGRNDPLADKQSELSPYLHFGQISSLTVARAVYDAVRADSSLQSDADAMIEELLVRKELSDNFCFYNSDYRSLGGAPQWAQTTLAKHADDERQFMYTLEQFENAQTHDEAWNAAQRQLRREGKIHGYMRMYWAKKVLEWSRTPQEALEYLLYLNDFYHLDGYDPNGYVGILWSVAGLHDRPWGERPVYGVIRSMVYNGLKRKFDIQAYIDAFPAR